MTPLRIDDADGVIVARISGEIDLSNAREVGEELAHSVPNTALGVVIDLTATEYLDSSGVHMIFDLAQRMGRRQQAVRVVVPEGAPIRRVLRIVELDEVVPVLAAMGESISRDELVRVVADRLSAEPGLVMRRVAAAGGLGRAGDGAAAKGSDQPAPGAARPARTLSARERRERALLAMCIASPADGREYLERLTQEYLSSPVMRRARDWLLQHLDDPKSGLPREDEELVSVIVGITSEAEREPGEREAMELNFLQLEQALIEGRIDAAQRQGGDPPVELQRRRAELAERIAHWEAAGTA
jgi:anti-anti-sigma factor